MKLTPQQLEQFDRDGYLFFPALFTPAEVKTLTDEVPSLYAQDRPENVREKMAPPAERSSRSAPTRPRRPPPPSR